MKYVLSTRGNIDIATAVDGVTGLNFNKYAIYSRSLDIGIKPSGPGYSYDMFYKSCIMSPCRPHETFLIMKIVNSRLAYSELKPSYYSIAIRLVFLTMSVTYFGPSLSSCPLISPFSRINYIHNS